MGSTLKIEPEYRKKTSLSDELKFALRRKNGGQTISHLIVDESDLSYFEGLRDAGIKDAEIVISLIGKYGSCVVSEDF